MRWFSLFLCGCLGWSASGRDEAKPDKAMEAEHKKLDGEWKIAAAEAGGQKIESKSTAVFAGAKCTLIDPGFPAVANTIVLDPTKEPKWIDLTNPATKTTFLGIYELKGDSLIATFQAEKDGRPTQFKTKKASAGVMYTYERVKQK